MGHHLCDVVDHNVDESLVVEPAVGDPVRQLAVPDKCVAPQYLSFARSEVDDSVTTRVTEGVSRRLGSIPLEKSVSLFSAC